MLPGVGNLADAVNAAIYLAEGDVPNALLSVVACIPLAGIASVGVKYTGKAADATLTLLKSGRMYDSKTASFIQEDTYRGICTAEFKFESEEI